MALPEKFAEFDRSLEVPVRIVAFSEIVLSIALGLLVVELAFLVAHFGKLAVNKHGSIFEAAIELGRRYKVFELGLNHAV